MIVGGLFLSGHYSFRLLPCYCVIVVPTGCSAERQDHEVVGRQHSPKVIGGVSILGFVFLIVGSIVVYSQLQFMKHQDLGVSSIKQWY